MASPAVATPKLMDSCCMVLAMELPLLVSVSVRSALETLQKVADLLDRCAL